MLNDRGGLSLIADFYGDDAMIELSWGWPRSAHKARITRIDADGNGSNPNDLEHCAHQVSFVLAIAIRLRKDLDGRVRSITPSTSKTGLNRNVLNFLNVLRDRANLLELSLCRCG